MKKLLAHLERVGGMLISPRATLRRILESGEANLLELVPWIILVTVSIAPIESGRAFLMLRVDFWEGVMGFVNAIAKRMTPAVAGALAGGIVLYLGELIFRTGRERRGLDLALDATAFTLVPHLLLTVIGALLSAIGVELAWLPHRVLRGPAHYQLMRLAIGFGWTVVLWVLLARMFWRGADQSSSIKSA